MFFLRSRRSIRRYKEEPVPGQRMIELLEIAWFAPSGHNSQGVSYLVVEGAQNLMRLREIVVEWMRETVKSSPPENPRRQEDYGNFDGGLSKIQVSPDTRTKPSGNCVV
jgi:nitroreductase